MLSFIPNVKLQINEIVYNKDPDSSELGKKIIKESIELIYEIGFEDFTFKKLSLKIKSTEASIYRYFDNKHSLLHYLTIWYWRWMEYKLIFGLANIQNPEERLIKSIQILTEPITEDSNFHHINEIKLNKIIISESAKVYLNKNVKKDNAVGLFLPYKELVERISQIIIEINPQYKYPHMLVSTIIEGAHYQRYFSEYLPKLTDLVKNEDAITTFYKKMATELIKKD